MWTSVLSNADPSCQHAELCDDRCQVEQLRLDTEAQNGQTLADLEQLKVFHGSCLLQAAADPAGSWSLICHSTTRAPSPCFS